MEFRLYEARFFRGCWNFLRRLGFLAIAFSNFEAFRGFSSTKPRLYSLIMSKLPSSWPVRWVMAKKGVRVATDSNRRLGPALPMTRSAAWI